MAYRVEEYVRKDGTIPFKDWFDRLDAQAAAKVATAVTRLSLGNVSNVKVVQRHRGAQGGLGAWLPGLPGEGH